MGDDEMKLAPSKVKSRVARLSQEIRDCTERIDYTQLSSKRIQTISDFKSLPAVSCVYFVCNGQENLLYVGKAANLRSRWTIKTSVYGEFIEELNHSCLLRILDMKSCSIFWWEVDKRMRTVLETCLIQTLHPLWNKQENFAGG